MPRVSILVASYRRPSSLRRLLESLRRLAPDSPPHRAIVIDNDVEGSARSVVESVSDLAVDYACEPVPNIARARNRALDLAPTELVAFVDDDETVAPDWLTRLLGALEGEGADGAFGPTVAAFESPPAAWIPGLDFHGNGVPPTGTALRWFETRTGNALLRRSLFAKHRFDERYGRTGGEDVELFARLILGGARFVSCGEATVREIVPPTRAHWTWMARRAYRNGLTIERIRRAYPSLEGPTHRGAGAAWKATTSLLRALARLPRSRVDGARESLRALEYAGIAAGALGFRMEEYG